MNDPQGTIVAITRNADGIRATVDVDAEAVCARCASGRGCGAGILPGRSGKRRLEVMVGPGLQLAEGDVVGIELAPRDVLRAALIVYGLPLTGAISGAALAYLAGLGDGAAAIVAIGGVCAGLMISRHKLRDDACLAGFTPTVTRRVATDL
jgi:sigma-E factor negative regulatory protein RseC